MPISDKQRGILLFPYLDYDALICDGAIRSGKSALMMVSFIDWAMDQFSGKRFAICGKTVGSVFKNVVEPYLGLNYSKKYRINCRRSENTLLISHGRRENIFEIFGGKDESSYMLIQGRTLAGVLLDEVVLQPRSFVEQALARCSIEGSKFWFNCNPSSPQHWFYKEWICDLETHNAMHLHFRIEDNPSLSADKIKQYNTMYKGVFYRRYILGEWCMAEGLVYQFGEKNITDEAPENGEYYVSIDYGTMNPFSAGLWCVLGAKATRVKEFYYNGREKHEQMTDEEYADKVEELTKGREIARVVVDPSAASFIAVLRRRGYTVVKAKNDVLDGIRVVAEMLQNGSLKIHRSCVDCIAEFGLYSWDEKATEDRVIKDNDHAMDDVRYFCYTVLRHKLK